MISPGLVLAFLFLVGQVCGTRVVFAGLWHRAHVRHLLGVLGQLSYSLASNSALSYK